ncbi:MULTISPECIES: cell wall metabolism sensor histidine kinase WalK [unclassified Fusibacter]|uniref:sensor histidine kinase n=1 Tax=unclassified Fusibacter TaxID=2624464 RepID=UPI0010135A52|nr:MULTISPECIES: ATP-binding protein [unclassified Fusibacter]MCK8060693.1 cell wall metabolism sensor histidine kinase WalK [Fusibacter sp. A2]NPE22853.1 HAMP domain-containing protein [Fusibacter sp. A1]RXV59922.1 HAMP domain-containing protein [Fusibacter sp. A1]
MNKLYFSIRWKLVSTYLLLVLISLLLINAFINASLTEYLMEEKKDNLLSQGTIVSDQIAPSISSYQNRQSLDYAESIIKSLSLRLNTRVLVVDRSGEVIVDSFDDYYGASLNSIDEVVNALNGFSSAQAYNFSDIGKAIYVGVPVYESGNVIGAILMSSSPVDIFNQIKEISENFYRLSIGAIIITAVVSFIFTDIFSTPIENLTQVVKEVALGNKNQKAKIHSRDELGNLAESFNTMITKLYHVDEMRKKFVSNVSHELRTPIASMKIIAETLSLSKPDDLLVYEDFMQDINSEMDRLNKIIDTLLNLVNLEKDELQLEYQPVVFNQLVKHTIQTIKPLAEQKDIHLTYEDTDPINTVVDSLKIRQCLINIINNAVKYTPDGGYVHVELYANREDLVVKVKDTGIGIPEEDLPHIFDRFYRVDEARARDTGGSGLGLSIAHQIISLHQGRIEVQSQAGVGTEFFIILPRKSES